MRQVLLDTSFILSCVRNKIDFFEELLEYQILIPKEVINELNGLEADLALKILTKYKKSFKMVNLSTKNVDKGIINPSTRIIPASYETYAVLLDYNFNEYRFYMPRAKHTTKDNLIKILANKQHISTINFDGTRKNPRAEKLVEYVINQDGNLNSIGLTSVARLSKNVSLGESTWINNSVVVPLKNRINVKKGEKVKLNIQYDMGSGFLNFKAVSRIL